VKHIFDQIPKEWVDPTANRHEEKKIPVWFNYIPITAIKFAKSLVTLYKYISKSPRILLHIFK